MLWRNDTLGQAGLRTPDSATEVVLTTTLPSELNWKVDSADEAVEIFLAQGGRIVAGPNDIRIGRVAVVEDPLRKCFGGAGHQ